MQRWQVKVCGVVQGVGFRPFVYALAHTLQLNGWVSNDSEGVLIEFDCPVSVRNEFVHLLQEQAPPLAKISALSCTALGTIASEQAYDEFRIVRSHAQEDPTVIVPLDAHVCESCLHEMHDPENRRYLYPFINCTDCGPRFSLMDALPYDRERTSMRLFTMCSACRAEYEDPTSRRYHAQIIACADCGPQLQWQDSQGQIKHGDSALEQTRKDLKAGQIVAIKGVGGFHLAVDAFNEKAVARLRQRKKRQVKPFAVMVPDLMVLQTLAELSELEESYLNSSARPIVLLKKRSCDLPENLAPGNASLGIMLPSTPLHYLFFDEQLQALVMTSGNVSGYPMEYTNQGAIERLFEVADSLLLHDRAIRVRLDDSVLRCTAHPQLEEPVITWFRKSRGYAPYVLDLQDTLAGNKGKGILSLGAELKNTIALKRAGSTQVYMSQHIGDLKNADAWYAQYETTQHLRHLYRTQTDLLAIDLHPSFSSHHRYSDEPMKKTIHVQHHHAHMAACMGEHQLNGQTLGVVFDGIGYGQDGHMWGGEFLYGDFNQVKRLAYLEPIALIGGDKAVYEPFRIALALVLAAKIKPEDWQKLEVFQQRPRSSINVLTQMFHKQVNTISSNGMGRLFDGVAALINICTHAEYEGHAPMALENLLAKRFDRAEAYDFYLESKSDYYILRHEKMIEQIVADLHELVPLELISRKFHSTVVKLIVDTCLCLKKSYDFKQIVLSGGVFVNEFVLINTLLSLRENHFSAYAHQQVPSGDGGVALGQLLVALHQENT